MSTYDAIVATYATHSPAEQAAMLGRRVSTVLSLRSAAIKAGHVQRYDRTANALWTPKQHRALVAALRAGDSLLVAGRKARRGVKLGTIYNHLAQYGGVTAIRTGYVWTGRQVERIFDVHSRAVALWVRRGWLAKSGGTSREYLYTRAAIERFLGVRDAWPMYIPEHITVYDFAVRARAERTQAGGDWIKARDWCKQHGYVPEYGKDLVERGAFERTLLVCGAWYVWQPL